MVKNVVNSQYVLHSFPVFSLTFSFFPFCEGNLKVSFLEALPSQQSWKLTGAFWKTTFLLGNSFVCFHGRWKEGRGCLAGAQ